MVCTCQDLVHAYLCICWIPAVQIGTRHDELCDNEANKPCGAVQVNTQRLCAWITCARCPVHASSHGAAVRSLDVLCVACYATTDFCHHLY